MGVTIFIYQTMQPRQTNFVRKLLTLLKATWSLEEPRLGNCKDIQGKVTPSTTLCLCQARASMQNLMQAMLPSLHP